MTEPTAEQMRCGYAQNGYPALCTCGTCDVVDEGCGCVWCDVGFNPGPDGSHRTKRGIFPCTKKK